MKLWQTPDCVSSYRRAPDWVRLTTSALVYFGPLSLSAQGFLFSLVSSDSGPSVFLSFQCFSYICLSIDIWSNIYFCLYFLSFHDDSDSQSLNWGPHWPPEASSLILLCLLKNLQNGPLNANWRLYFVIFCIWAISKFSLFSLFVDFLLWGVFLSKQRRETAEELLGATPSICASSLHHTHYNKASDHQEKTSAHRANPRKLKALSLFLMWSVKPLKCNLQFLSHYSQ